MIYVEHDGERITNLFSAHPDTVLRQSHSAIEVPIDFVGSVGDPVAAYDETWRPKPMSDLIARGVVEPPDGAIWDDENSEWRVATDKELVESGRLTVGDREVLDGDSIRDMTPDELDQRGLLTDEERRDWKKSVFMTRLSEIDRESTRPLRAVAAGLDMDYDRQRLTELENEAVSIRAELAALESELTE